MSLARLAIDSLPEPDQDVRQIIVDCRHGTTRVHYANATQGLQLTDDDSIRIALVRHHAEEGCHCIRTLWRDYFGCPWPEIRLVSAEVPA